VYLHNRAQSCGRQINNSVLAAGSMFQWKSRSATARQKNVQYLCIERRCAGPTELRRNTKEMIVCLLRGLCLQGLFSQCQLALTYYLNLGCFIVDPKMRGRVRVCVNVCMYVYICMYVCIYVCMYVYMYVCVNVCMYICMCIYMCVYVYMYVYMYVWMYIYVCVCVYM
jgi:hypothetical protein